MRKLTVLLGASLLLAAPAVLAGKGNIEAGAKKSQTCHACHGATGNGGEVKDPQYPKIGGQYRDYLVYALKSYKDGTRSNLIMKGFADVLSEQDIEDLAAYYASQPAELDDLSHLE